MSSKKLLKTYQVQVGDCSLRLKSSHDSATLNAILKVVDDQFQAIKAGHQSLSMQKTLALSCLNLAEELVCLKQALRQQTDQLELTTQSLFSDLKSSSVGFLG